MTPILYSEPDCPHCIRARLSLAYAQLPFELRSLARPDEDARLPVLEIVPGESLRASGDILHWALLKHDPDGLMDYEVDLLDAMHDLVRINDSSFSKDASRALAGGKDRDAARADCALFLDGLEQRLERHRYLFADRECFADLALFPFVLRLAAGDEQWFSGAGYPKLRRWLQDFANRPLFRAVMQPVPAWESGGAPFVFGAESSPGLRTGL